MTGTVISIFKETLVDSCYISSSLSGYTCAKLVDIAKPHETKLMCQCTTTLCSYIHGPAK